MVVYDHWSSNVFAIWLNTSEGVVKPVLVLNDSMWSMYDQMIVAALRTAMLGPKCNFFVV